MELLPTIPAFAAACAAAAYVSLAPRNQFWGPVTHRGATDAPSRYALTFDDGPTDPFTHRILDTLARHNAKAAFFVIGANARRAPELLRRIHDEGHLVANHSLDHSHYGIMRLGWYWQRQIEQTNRLIADIIGQTPALFRPPMGVRQLHIMRAARRNGLATVTWSRRALDGVATTPQRIVDRLAPDTQPGDILVLHDGIQPHRPHHDPTPTVEALAPLITALRARNLEPTRLDQLTGLPPYHPA